MRRRLAKLKKWADAMAAKHFQINPQTLQHRLQQIIEGGTMDDRATAKIVEFAFDDTGKLWVNVDGVCVLRVGKAENIVFNDATNGETLNVLKDVLLTGDPETPDDEDRSPYVTVTHGMRGFFAVHMWWNPEPGYWEPMQSGVGSYDNPSDAHKEAQDWARNEEIRYVP